MSQRTFLHQASWLLTAIGALNWGLVGTTDFDLVQALFGEDTFATRLVYTVVGLAGIWSTYHLISKLTSRAAAPAGTRPFARTERF